jgi:hypothetical protein
MPRRPVDRNITSDDLIVELDRLAALRGFPAVLRCDNGRELACAAMADWAGERHRPALHPTRPALAQRLCYAGGMLWLRRNRLSGS